MNLKKLLPSVAAEAHCDVPCGIYDPTPAKIAAVTVLRMVNQMLELKAPEDGLSSALSHYQNDLVRRINTKEAHAELCKKEILILWTDYFKPEHLEKYPDLHELLWTSAKLCSQNKQDVNPDKAKELVEAVDKIAKIFYETKNAPERLSSYENITNTLF